jgi:hypothetical protein
LALDFQRNFLRQFARRGQQDGRGVDIVLGLREKIRGVLLDLGARPDWRFTQYACYERMGRADGFASVALRVATLQPVAPPAPLTGSWKGVDLIGRERLDAGDCELVRYIVEQILPLFAVRNVPSTPTCLAYGPSSMTSFALEVFAADRSPSLRCYDAPAQERA